MRVLGIDPGSARTGYGLVEGSRGRMRLVDCGLINGECVPKDKRLLFLAEELGRVIERLQPEAVSVEKLFFSKNKRTATDVSEARGVILLTVGRYKLPLFEFSPSDVKSVVVGNGRANKNEVGRVVCYTLGVPSLPGPDDVSDALALAIRASFENGRLIA